MAAIRKVYGPFHPELVSGGYDFHFFGIRDDHQMAKWVLRYDAETRTFSAFNVQIGNVGGRMMSHAIQRENINVSKMEPDRQAFVSGQQLTVHVGRVTDILRQHLKPEHLAMCAALSITKRK